MDEPPDHSQASAGGPGAAVRQVAHDLNNSLTLIIGYSQLLNRSLDDPQLRGLVDEIERAAHQAAGLAGQLVNLTRPDDGAPVTDLGSEIVSLQPVLARLAGPGVSVTVASPDHPVKVAVAPGEIEEILINLVARAAVATGNGAETTTVMVVVQQESGGAVLTVTGDGPGGPATSADGPGLSTVLGLVGARHGHVDVDSPPGLGSVVRVWLPLHDEVATGSTAAGSAAAPDRAIGAGSSRPSDRTVAANSSWPPNRTVAAGSSWPPDRTVAGRILFVEDEPELRRMGQESLATTGVEVVAVESAETALATLAGDGPFDALVTDIVLPGRTGVQLVEAVRQAHPGLRVLYVTGYSGPADPTRTPASSDPVLRKPYRPDDLRFRVAELLEKAAP